MNRDICIHMTPCLAIIDSNTLSSIALKEILEEMFPGVEVLSFQSIEAFFADCNHHFVHFFVSSQMLFANAGEFDMLKKETIVLSEGPCPAVEGSGFKVIDVSLPEKELVSSILRLHETGHPGGRHPSSDPVSERLSAREKDVLALMVKGHINKEIADMLDISVTTVIFHRNNICEKLGTRSLARLTIYAVISNLVSIADI